MTGTKIRSWLYRDFGGTVVVVVGIPLKRAKEVNSRRGDFLWVETAERAGTISIQADPNPEPGDSGTTG